MEGNEGTVHINSQAKRSSSAERRHNPLIRTSKRFDTVVGNSILEEYRNLDMTELENLAQGKWQDLQRLYDEVVTSIDVKSVKSYEARADLKNDPRDRDFWRSKTADIILKLGDGRLLAKFYTYVDALAELMRVYKAAGFWEEMINRSHLNHFHSQELEELYAAKLDTNLRLFTGMGSNLISMFDKIDSYPLKFQQEWISKELDKALTSVRAEYRHIEQAKKRETGLHIEGFDARPKARSVVDAALETLMPADFLPGVNKISFDSYQPVEVDKKGNERYTAGTWNTVTHEVTFHPASIGFSGIMGSPALMGSIFAHEIGGHGMDGIFNKKSAVAVPPWIQIRLLKVLDKYNPSDPNKAATEYVTHVAEENTRGNVTTGDLKWAPWYEQFAEMMMILRVNPAQFKQQFGNETYAAFKQYCEVVEGCPIRLEERAAAFQMVLNYSILADPAYPAVADAIDFVKHAFNPRVQQRAKLEDKLRLLQDFAQNVVDIDYYPSWNNGIKHLLELVEAARADMLLDPRKKEVTYELVSTDLEETNTEVEAQKDRCINLVNRLCADYTDNTLFELDVRPGQIILIVNSPYAVSNPQE